jgi:hypothetical protein
MAAVLEVALEKREYRPRVRQTPHILEYLRAYLQEMEYIESYEQRERPGKLRRRVYWTLRGVAEACNTPHIMRIMNLHQSANWERI